MDSLLKSIHDELGISSNLLAKNRLAFCEQAQLNELEVVEIDYEGKPFLLSTPVAQAWRDLRAAAERDGILLRPYSGFRSYLYQKTLIEKHLKNGRALESILTHIAIPGFSEHHTGRAIDICPDGRFILDEDFEKTDAFAWLMKNADRFKFRLSYPRNNNTGIIYEPWHWYFVG